MELITLITPTTRRRPLARSQRVTQCSSVVRPISGWHPVIPYGLLMQTDGWIYFGDRYDLPHPSLGTDATGDFHLWRPIRLPITFPTSSTMSINWNNAWSFDSAFPSVSGPAQAIDLRASILGASAVLAWQNNEPKGADIYLDRATDPEFTQNVVADLLPQGTTSFTDSLIQPGLKYFYRVRTVNASGSSFSSTAATGSGRPATFRPSRKRRKYNHYLPNGSLRKKYEKRRRLAQCA
jgi:hypothetical protein